MTRAEALDRMRAFLVKKNPKVAPEAIGETTDLIASRILSSLQLIELILFIERETGRAILVEDLDPKRIRTLDAIWRSFYDPVP